MKVAPQVHSTHMSRTPRRRPHTLLRIKSERNNSASDADAPQRQLIRIELLPPIYNGDMELIFIFPFGPRIR